MEVTVALYCKDRTTFVSPLPDNIPIGTKAEEIRTLILPFIPEERKRCCQCLVPLKIEDRNCHFQVLNYDTSAIIIHAYACLKNPACQERAKKCMAMCTDAAAFGDLLCSLGREEIPN